MHRSGTSTVARLINLLGAYLGDDELLREPLPDNPEGFWERRDIVLLHERVLAALGTTWAATLPLPAGWSSAEAMRPFKIELCRLIETTFAEHRLWAWKDPRTCLLLPLWRDVLRELGIGLACVFVVRNPLDVANSLNKRNGFPINKSLGIWFNYNLSGLLAVNTLPTVFVSYDALLSDWRHELRRCCDALGLDWRHDQGAFERAVTDFLKPGHRHSMSDPTAVRDVNPLVDKLFGIILPRALSSRRHDATCNETTRAMYKQFQDYSAFFSADLCATRSLERELMLLKEHYAYASNWRPAAPVHWLRNLLKPSA